MWSCHVGAAGELREGDLLWSQGTMASMVDVVGLGKMCVPKRESEMWQRRIVENE